MIGSEMKAEKRINNHKTLIINDYQSYCSYISGLYSPYYFKHLIISTISFFKNLDRFKNFILIRIAY